MNPQSSPPAQRLSKKIIPAVKALLSVFSFTIVCGYFDVFAFIQSPEAITSGYATKAIWCLLVAILLYIFNYITFIIRPRPSQRITVERWYTVSPLTVWIIMICHVFGLIFLVALLWPQYGIMAILITFLFAFMVLNVFQYSPI